MWRVKVRARSGSGQVSLESAKGSQRLSFVSHAPSSTAACVRLGGMSSGDPPVGNSAHRWLATACMPHTPPHVCPILSSQVVGYSHNLDSEALTLAFVAGLAVSIIHSFRVPLAVTAIYRSRHRHGYSTGEVVVLPSQVVLTVVGGRV